MESLHTLTSDSNPSTEQDTRLLIIAHILRAIKAFKNKSRPEWRKLVELLIIDTKDVRPECQLRSYEALAEASKLAPSFPSYIFTYASQVVVSGDGMERAHAAMILCNIAEHRHSWPVSKRYGHLIAAVDDALLSLAVGMQDMNPQVRWKIACLLPRLHAASEKYAWMILDKRKTIMFQRVAPGSSSSKLPEAPESILDNASGALSQLLEDEFSYVRCAAARAVAAFSRRSAALAEVALDLLMTAMYDDLPVIRVAAVAGMRAVLAGPAGAVLSVTDCGRGAPGECASGKGRSPTPKKTQALVGEFFRTVRIALDDCSTAVRLAAVRLLQDLKFPDASVLTPVIHRLITLANPLQWKPLPVEECRPKLQSLPGPVPPQEEPYATCCLCMIETLRTLHILSSRNSDHAAACAPLLASSLQGFLWPDVEPLKGLFQVWKSKHSADGDCKPPPGGDPSSRMDVLQEAIVKGRWGPMPDWSIASSTPEVPNAACTPTLMPPAALPPPRLTNRDRFPHPPGPFRPTPPPRPPPGIPPPSKQPAPAPFMRNTT